MNLIPAKMLKAYRTGDLEITQSWADLEASRIIDAKLLGAKFAKIDLDLAQEVSDRTAAVSTEKADREAAISTLQADVDQNEEDADAAMSTEIAARELGDETLSTNLSTEVAAREAAVSALQADVDQNEEDADAAMSTEVAARELGDSTLSTNLSTEVAARIDGDAGLLADLSTEIAAREAAVSTLQADVDQNEADSDAANVTLQSNIDDEESLRIAGDNALSAALAAETNARIEGDETLSTNLATETGRIDAILDASEADKDSFAEIVSVINAVDTANDEAFAAYVLSNNEVVSTLQPDVDQNEEDADAAMSTEIAARELGDETLSTNLAALQDEVDALDGDFVSDDDFVAVTTTFANAAFSAFVGTTEFTIADVEGLVAGTMSVFINGIEIHGAEGNFESGITLPFEIESSDLISIKYVKA